MRTHVPFVADIRTRPAGARRVPAHQLVPSARGRRSRRLGGRRERASRRSSTPGAAARAHRAAARDSAAPGPAAACGPGLYLAGQRSVPRRPASASWTRSRGSARACARVLRALRASGVACGGPGICRPPAHPTPLRLAVTDARRAPSRRPKSRGPPEGGPSQKNRRRPTLPGPRGPSTIGAEGLNCSVRNGKRCFPLAKATGKRRETAAPGPSKLHSATRASQKSVKPSTH